MNDTPLSDVAVALGRVPSGLFVVTARNSAGEETAFLASWVMQAGFDPPALSVAVGEDRADSLAEAGRFWRPYTAIEAVRTGRKGSYLDVPVDPIMIKKATLMAP